MNASAIFILILLIYIIFISNCLFFDKTVRSNLNEVEDIVIESSPFTYKIEIEIFGKMLCSSSYLEILMDGKKTNTTINIPEKGGVTYSCDWYENKLSFRLINKECIGKDTQIIVKQFR